MMTLFSVGNPYIIFWLVLMIICIVVELATVGLISIWFAAGALAALIVASFGANVIIQMLVFLVVSIALLIATRSWAVKFINSRTQKTNADSLIGEDIRITEQVNNLDQTGTAVVRGQEWTVRALDDTLTIAKGELARVVSISGVKLIVEKINPEKEKEE